MAQGLQLAQRMTMSQVLAPQLQQSLALLQAPTLELKALVEAELQQNPVLEEIPAIEAVAEDRGESEAETAKVDATDLSEPPSDVIIDPTADTPSNPVEDNFQAEFERLVQIDQEWRDHFASTNAPMRQSQDDEEKRQFMFDSLVAGTSLQVSLLDQVGLSELGTEQRSIAELIVGNIDEMGYLQSSPDELAFSTNIPVDKIREVLRVVQSFNPPGIGARDLRECLMLQLERDGRTELIEYRIISEHMDALGRRKLPDIARALGLGIDEVQAAVSRISLLEPRPGRAFQADNNQYIMPEVFVTKVGEDYLVTTNNEQVPHLRISNVYKDLMSQSESSDEVRDYIREKIRAGKFLIKSIHQRQQTILNIAREIVNRQRDFMDQGVTALKPMTMVQVAEVVGVHETTVSRAVSGKFMETPQGIFEMKFFFTSGIQTSSGVGVSNTSVKDMISDMIKREDTSKPLSDEEIVKILSEKGIKIARRTVAKYRSELNILPSHLRKVY